MFFLSWLKGFVVGFKASIVHQECVVPGWWFDSGQPEQPDPERNMGWFYLLFNFPDTIILFLSSRYVMESRNVWWKDENYIFFNFIYCDDHVKGNS